MNNRTLGSTESGLEKYRGGRLSPYVLLCTAYPIRALENARAEMFSTEMNVIIETVRIFPTISMTSRSRTIATIESRWVESSCILNYGTKLHRREYPLYIT